MKIIDQTPLQDEHGEISLVNRAQGALKFGLSWYANVRAQKPVIAIFNRVLERGFTLLRNQQLGASGIIVPLILVGTPGIYVLDVTPLKGFYRARGDEWGTVSNEVFQPAPINILKRTAQLAKVLEKFFERQGAKLSAPIEPILLAADPGMHIDSVRPAVRVVMSDAIERFAAGLLSARPVYNAAQINDLVERIVNPRSARAQQPEPPAANDPFAVKDERPFPAMEASRMQSILNAPQSDALIESGEQGIDFALQEEPPSNEPTVMVSNPAPPQEEPKVRPATPARSRRILGMTVVQILILLGIFLCGCVSIVGILGASYYLGYLTLP